MATPSESGTAIVRATTEESRVPKISGNAPNSSATGSQVLEVTKLEPEALDREPGPAPELEDQEAEEDRDRRGRRR